jgi:hypothetical protein
LSIPDSAIPCTDEGSRIAKLIEDLMKEGSSEPTVVEKPITEEEQEFSEAELQRVLRRTIVFERRSRGDTVEEICTFLHSKGHRASRRTVFYDLRSEEVYTLIDELIRQQFRDIALLRGYALQDTKNPDLKALAAAIRERGVAISWFKPKLEPNLKVELDVTNQTAVSVTVVGELLKQYQQFVRESEEASVIRVDGVAKEQSVSKADADGQAKSIS